MITISTVTVCDTAELISQISRVALLENKILKTQSKVASVQGQSRALGLYPQRN